MALFQKSSSIIKDRDVAQANRDRLAGKLNDAEVAIIAAKSLAQRAALDGDDAALDAAEAAEHTAQRRHGTITAALAETEKLLALLESQIAEAADKKLRAATAAETEALADEFSQAAAGFDISTGILAEVAARAALVCFEATGVANFAAASRPEVATGVEAASALLREHAKMVLNGTAAATLPQPHAIVVPEKIVAPVTVRLFSMKAVKWSADGGLRYAPKYAQVDLPPAVADRALAIYACVEMGSDACRMFSGTHVPGSGNLADNVSLDEGGETDVLPVSPEPIQFQRVDRGATYQLRTVGGGS